MPNVTNYNLRDFYNGILKKDNPLYAYQFIAEFSGLDERWGITNSSEAKSNITYYVQSANIPGVQLTNAPTPFFGTEFRNPGVAKYDHTWTCNILLEQNLIAYKGFRRWMEEISSLRNDGGGFKGIPDVTVSLSVLDSSGTSKVQAIVLEGVWCSGVGDLQLRYENGGSAPINNFPITLKYQYNYMDDANNFDKSTDPLKA